MTVSLRSDISTTPVDDGMILLNERTGRYWQLNANGTLVLNALLSCASTAEAARHLREEHPRLPVMQAEADVSALLTSLRNALLLTS
ncbi:lasso peptide biosynthesis PqqD family chaperone [Streptomyces sp. NPDC057908]|uniref:lasso peptide biosynthesis PqqD family chaperone n=1 Tax=Streptomyces sp. NPDC057908 TaxID=3346276 RepID=UPI0036EF3343